MPGNFGTVVLYPAVGYVTPVAWTQFHSETFAPLVTWITFVANGSVILKCNLVRYRHSCNRSYPCLSRKVSGGSGESSPRASGPRARYDRLRSGAHGGSGGASPRANRTARPI